VNHKKKLAKLQDELEKIAMVGYDDSFIGFMKFMIEQVKKDSSLKLDEQERRIADYQSCMDEYQLLHENIQEGKKLL